MRMKTMMYSYKMTYSYKRKQSINYHTSIEWEYDSDAVFISLCQTKNKNLPHSTSQSIVATCQFSVILELQSTISHQRITANCLQGQNFSLQLQAPQPLPLEARNLSRWSKNSLHSLNQNKRHVNQQSSLSVAQKHQFQQIHAKTTCQFSYKRKQSINYTSIEWEYDSDAVFISLCQTKNKNLPHSTSQSIVATCQFSVILELQSTISHQRITANCLQGQNFSLQLQAPQPLPLEARNLSRWSKNSLHSLNQNKRHVNQQSSLSVAQKHQCQ